MVQLGINTQVNDKRPLGFLFDITTTHAQQTINTINDYYENQIMLFYTWFSNNLIFLEYNTKIFDFSFTHVKFGVQWVQINKHVMKRISHILKWYIIFVILPLRFFLNYIQLQRHPIYKYSAFSLRKWKRQYVSNSYLHSYCFSKRDIIHLFHNYFIQQKYSIAKAVAKKI